MAKRPTANDIVAPTLEAFLRLISKERELWGFDKDDVGGPWYRGQQRKHWSLVPNVVRLGCFGEARAMKATRLEREFTIRAPRA